MLDLTVNAVKAHLAPDGPARGHQRAGMAKPAPRRRHPPWPAMSRSSTGATGRAPRAAGRRRAAVQIDLSAGAGAADVGMFFGIYSRSAPVRSSLPGRWPRGDPVYEIHRREPSYLMWLEWADGRISFIRDYKYVATSSTTRSWSWRGHGVAGEGSASG